MPLRLQGPTGAALATSPALTATFVGQSQAAATYARRGVRDQGAIIFTWDDGFTAHDTIRAMATARGQRHTFCINTGSIGTANHLTNAQILAASNEGHEIASHSVTHTNMTGQTTAQRATEWDTSKAAIEAIIGSGKVTSFAYPFGSASAGRNATTDAEAYLRYGRLLDTVGSIGKAAYAPNQAPFLISRASYDPTNAGQQAQLLSYIRKAATSPVIISVYCHDVTAGTAMTNVTAAMDLAQSLGVPCITAAEAFPGHPRYVIDAGFEDYATVDTTTPWYKAGGTPTIITDTAPDGLPGSKSLYLTAADTSPCYVTQVIPVKAGAIMSASWKARVNQAVITAGGLKAYIALRYGALNTAGTTEYSGAQTSLTWATGSKDFTVPATATWAEIQITMTTVAGGEFWVDHLWIDEKSALGTFG